MNSASDGSGFIVAALVIGIVHFLLGCFCIIIGALKIKKEKTGRQTRVWYSRLLIIVGFAIIVYELGQVIPDNAISLIVFHGSLVPGTSDFGSQVYRRFNFFNGLSLISQILCLVLVIWAAIVGIREKRKSDERK